jgi:hypothetical protein
MERADHTAVAIWDDIVAGRMETTIMIKPNDATPHDFPCPHLRSAGTSDLSWGFPTREPSPEMFLLTSGNYQHLFARTGHGPVHVDAPEPLAPYIERGRP